MIGAAAGQPGQVILAEFPEPEAGAGEVIVAPLVCGVCATDVKTVHKGAKKVEFALGHELAGKIIAAPPGGRWAVGQRVVAAPYLPCGACYYCRHEQPTLCTHLFEVAFTPGGMAERVRLPRRLVEQGLLAIPDDLSDDLAALSEPVGCVIKGIEDARVRPGDAVLVIGDGPMGLFSATVARAYGAYPVIVAGMTPHRLEAARRLCADQVIDVSHADLLAETRALTDGRGADVVMVAVSSPDALQNGIAAVRPGGVVNAFAGVPEGATLALDVRRLHYQQYFLTGSFGVGPVHLAKALALIASRRAPFAELITARFAFPAVAEAIAYAAEQKGLKAVVTFAG